MLRVERLDHREIQPLDLRLLYAVQPKEALYLGKGDGADPKAHRATSGEHTVGLPEGLCLFQNQRAVPQLRGGLLRGEVL